MDLPPALAPWKDALAAVSPEVAAALGDWLLKLAPAVGPLRTRTLVGTGEPDGYDGLLRRGPYERLLLSEWLLATEAPEEFVRRAATRELAFHRMAHREPADARASVALFDAGPSQLGVPRLVHVAALVLLAQRAAKAKARFGWAVLQRPPGAPDGGGLTLGLTAQNVDNILHARSATAPADADLDAWAALEARGEGWGDVWFVGARDAWDRWRARARRRPGATGGCLAVADAREPEGQRVRVSVIQRSTVTDVTLAPPDDATCVRLLRSVAARATERRPPAAQSARPRGRRYTAAHAPATNLVFSPTGNMLAWRTASGALMLSGVPKYPNGHREKLRMYANRRGETILGVGWVHRRLVLLTCLRGELLLFNWNGSDFPRASAHRPWPLLGPEPVLTRAARALEPLLVYRIAHVHFAALRLSDGSLVRLDRDVVRTLRPPFPGDAFVRHERLVVEEPFPMGGGIVSGPPMLEGIESVKPVAPLVLAATRDQAAAELAAHPEAKAAIVVAAGPLVVERIPRGGDPSVLHTLPAPVASLTLDPRAGLLALATQGGHVLVLDVAGDRGALVDWTPEAAP
ncbi:MAG: hypothetical protein U0324_26875 [Polyangiales bacterium]